jgi:hypothetical protein
MMEGPCADSEEKREPAGDIDTVVVDGLKVLDPKRPIREADIVLRPIRSRAIISKQSRGRAPLIELLLGRSVIGIGDARPR